MRFGVTWLDDIGIAENCIANNKQLIDATKLSRAREILFFCIDRSLPI